LSVAFLSERSERLKIGVLPGEPSQAAAVRYAAVESPYPAKGRSASKLPVSAPGRAALPSATPNLNIGMDIWNTSPALAVPAVQGEANPGLALARRDSVTQLVWMAFVES
jgi:plant G-box-binding factor